MTSQLTVQHITREARRLTRDEFVARLEAPLLIETSGVTEADAKQDFMTDAMTEAELVRKMREAKDGSVFFVRKCAGGLFSGHIGVGRTANLDISIPRQGVSKFHAYFSTAPNGQYQLTDKGSKNGTFVDDVRLTPGLPVDLADGVIVRFAVHSFRFSTAAAFYDLVHGMHTP